MTAATLETSLDGIGVTACISARATLGAIARVSSSPTVIPRVRANCSNAGGTAPSGCSSKRISIDPPARKASANVKAASAWLPSCAAACGCAGCFEAGG
jgi:hypothetical protein